MTKKQLIEELKKAMELNEQKQLLYRSGKRKMVEARVQLMENTFKKTRAKLIKALYLFSKYGSLRQVEKHLKLSRNTISRYINTCPAYKEMWQVAHERYIDSLEEVADKRARLSSDTLLKFLLRANRSKYKDLSSVNQVNNSYITQEEVSSLAAQIAKEITKEIANKTVTNNRRKIPTVDVIDIPLKEVENNDSDD